MSNNTKRIAIYEQVTVQNGEPTAGGEVLADLAFMEARVMDEAELMEHPLEDGSKIVDHKVHQPIEVTIQASLDLSLQAAATNAYNEFKQLYQDGTLLMVKTSVDVYDNMLIQGIPYEELPNSYDRIIFNISLKEAIIVESQYIPLPPGKVRNPSDASTTLTGEKQPTENKQSLLDIIIFGRNPEDPGGAQ